MCTKAAEPYIRLKRVRTRTVSLPDTTASHYCTGSLRVISIKHVNVHIYMLPIITCLSIFKVVNLSYRYVLSCVNILKYLPGTYYMERLIIAKVTIDRSILMSAL